MDLLSLLKESKKSTTKFSTFECHGYTVKVDKDVLKKIEEDGIKFYPRHKRSHAYFYNATVGYLHRWIIREFGKEKIDSNSMVDHINGSTEDNRLENLRVTDRSQNSHNIKRINFYFHRGNKKWTAEMTNRGVRKRLGYFDTKEEAKEAYINYARETRGDYHPFDRETEK
jgi:hypothetical protein